ncbi:MAG: acetate--CoA ligase family protein [Isosphaeraceae bacterium]
MFIRRVVVLRGPNLWTDVPVLEAEIETTAIQDRSAERIAQGLRSLLAALESLDATGSAGSSTLDAASVLLFLATRLQGVCGASVGFSSVDHSNGAGLARIAFAYEEEELARECLQAAETLIAAAAAGEAIDLNGEVARLRDVAAELLPGPTSAAIVRAARARGIPVRRLLPDKSLYQLGQSAKLRRIYGSTTDRTRVVDQCVSQDKELTKAILHGIGLPVPQGRAAADPEYAWAAAQEIGLPVVVKPRDFDYGHGIGLNLTSREQVVAAYHVARERSGGVLVERFVPGDDHRVLVIDGRVVAVSRRRPPRIVGDGVSTIAELVDRVNADPRRGVEPTSHLRVIRLGEVERATLADQGYAPSAVLPAGISAVLRRNSHLRNGGSMTDETDRIHPRVAAQAVEAAGVLGLDVAGLDIVADDLREPLESQGGAILEVNAGPGFDLHIAPWASHPRPVAEELLASLYPGAETGRIPIVAVASCAGAAAAARRIAEMFERAGKRAGLACADGSFVGKRRLAARDGLRHASVRSLLANTSVEALVCEVLPQSLREEGLPFERCDLLVIPDAEGDALSADVARCLLGVVDPAGAVVVHERHPFMETLIASAGRRVFLVREGGSIALPEQDAENPRRRVKEIYRRTRGAAEPLPSEPADDAALAAVAAALALELPSNAFMPLWESKVALRVSR